MRKVINLIYGPLTGLPKLIRRMLKLIACGALGWLAHWALLSTLLAFDEDKIQQLEALEAGISAIADMGNAFTFEFCMSPDYSKGADISACDYNTDEYRDVILGFNVSENGDAVTSNVILAHASLFPASIVDSPKIVHSQHSLSRAIERIAFNPTNQRASAIRLCEGTARKLDDTQCQAMNKIREEGLDPLIGNYFVSNFRIFTLLFGDIQWLTISLFLFGLSEVFGRYLRWVSPKPTLYKRSTTDGENRVEPVQDFETALKNYSKAPLRSIPDRMADRAAVGAGVFSTAASAGVAAPASNSASETSLEGYRDFLDAEAEANMESLHTTNELVLKLAFAGTIWGIGSALFSARSLDVSDPVLKVLAKADMFGSIGTAFGTTLLGVILSAFLSVFLQSLSSSWSHKINRSYLEALNLRDQLRGTHVDPTHKPSIPPSPKADFLTVLGGLVVLLIAVLVLYFLFIQ